MSNEKKMLISIETDTARAKTQLEVVAEQWGRLGGAQEKQALAAEDSTRKIEGLHQKLGGLSTVANQLGNAGVNAATRGVNEALGGGT